MEGTDSKSIEESRFLYIVDKVKEHNPTAIVIDGIADIMHAPNDEQESKDIVMKLCQLCTSENIALLTVIHENKSKDDQNPRGHLGSELLRKAVSIFHVTKDRDKGTFKVENTECRNRDIDTWSFTINSHGIPEIVETVDKQAEKAKAKLEALKTNFTRIFANGIPMQYSELRQKYMDMCGVKTRCAENKIKDATENGIIIFEGGKYSLPPP